MGPIITITSQAEYEQAISLLQELQGALEGSPEESELASLQTAIDEWDRNFSGEIDGDFIEGPFG